jgi:hypothetical protein
MALPLAWRICEELLFGIDRVEIANVHRKLVLLPFGFVTEHSASDRAERRARDDTNRSSNHACGGACEGAHGGVHRVSGVVGDGISRLERCLGVRWRFGVGHDTTDCINRATPTRIEAWQSRTSRMQSAPEKCSVCAAAQNLRPGAKVRSTGAALGHPPG